MVKNFRALLDYKGNGPGEKVHKVRQQIGVGIFHKLLDIEGIVLDRKRSTSNLMTAALLL